MRSLFAPLLTLTLAACAHLPGELRHEEAGAASWEAVFAPGPRVQVVPLVTGEVAVKRSFLLDLDHHAIEDRSDGERWVPVVAWLVRHPTAGDVLLDTGFDHTFAASGSGNFGGLAFLVAFARQQPGHDTVSQLRALGVDPAGLRRIVLSHMHPDHTAGLPDLPKHVPVFAGPGALASYGAPWYAPADHLAGIETLHTFVFPEGAEALDLFGDGSLLALPTPGHAAGNLSFLVRAEGGPVLLTCDASHTREGFERGVAPGGVDDRVQAEASLAKLRRFVAAHPGLRVKAGHEPADFDLSRGTQDPL